MATLDINGVELLAKHATGRPAALTDTKDLGSGKLEGEGGEVDGEN